MKQHD